MIPYGMSTTINDPSGLRGRALAVQQLERGLVHAGVAGRDDAAAALGGLAFPVGDDAAGAGDDRDQGRDVIGLESVSTTRSRWPAASMQ